MRAFTQDWWGFPCPRVGKQRREADGGKPRAFELVKWCPVHAWTSYGSNGYVSVLIRLCRRYTESFPETRLNSFVFQPQLADGRSIASSSDPVYRSSSCVKIITGLVVSGRPASQPSSGNTCTTALLLQRVGSTGCATAANQEAVFLPIYVCKELFVRSTIVSLVANNEHRGIDGATHGSLVSSSPTFCVELAT